MKSSFIALAALAAAASAQSVGYATVVNSCSSNVWLYNTPAADGGCTEEDKVLSTGDSYTQQYTVLTNLMGWSMKLANVSDSIASIMQYEYTFLNDGVIWYDMSDVNGNPWDGNWKFTSSDSDCKPTHGAYMYSTDDANGMQSSCSQSANITVTLCAMDDSSDGSDATAAAASSVIATAASSVAAPSSSAAATSSYVAATSSYVAPSTTAASSVAAPSTTDVPSSSAASSSAVSWSHYHGSWKQENAVNTPTSVAAPSTTMVTSVLTTPSASLSDDNVVWVTDVAYTTEFVTAAKRDVHHKHQHHARHPHGARA